ncbi:nitroreductase/quinone reductase family protein [Nocardia sp. BMG111209]|uniref:nitroreductase/quinone reductase family protein n=1 Tax=Nocardia sp. BMG111209 TaxID=1160137 RepID=UPI000365F78F|nr:nitroreductase/quinone reductase family protein [Nocardia sp. BMG111209]
MSSPAPARPARASRTQRTVDTVMRAVLRSPLHRPISGKLLVVTVIGRKTGRRIPVPVAYAEHDGALLVGTSAAWRRNLRPGAPVEVTLRGRTVAADWDIVSEEEQAADLYKVILVKNATHGRFVQIALEPDGEVNRADLRRALDRGVVVLRLRPRAN